METMKEKIIPKTSQQENEEPQMEEQIEEKESLKKLEKADTEALVKTEMKHLVMAKVFQQLDITSLTTKRTEMSKQIIFLDKNAEELQNELKTLQNNVKVIEESLNRCDKRMLEMNQVIDLVKIRAEKLEEISKQSLIHPLYEEVLEFQKQISEFKECCFEEVRQEQERLQKIEAEGLEKISSLQKGVHERREYLNELEFKVEEMEKINKISKEIIAKSMDGDSCNLQKEIDDLVLSNQEYLKKLEEAETRRIKSIEEISNLKENRLKCLKTLNEEGEHLNLLLKEKCLNSASCVNFEQIEVLNKINEDFFKKYEQKWASIEENLELQAQNNKRQIALIKKQTANEMLRNKFNELKREHEAASEKIMFLESSKQRQQQEFEDNIKKVHEQFHEKVALHDRGMEELKKRKEYALANLNFLQEKSNDLKNKISEKERDVKKEEEEDIKVLLVINNKKQELEELTKKIELLQKSEKPIKSALKENAFTKTVTFNNVISFKSPSSSEDVGCTSKAEDLESSLHDWLQCIEEEEM